MARFIAEQIIRFRIPVLAIIVVAGIFMCGRLAKIEMMTNLKDFAPQDHPYVMAQNYMEEWFLGGNMVQMAIRVKKGDAFNSETLGMVSDLTRELYLTEGVIPPRILSICDIKTKLLKGYPGGFEARRLMEWGVPESEEKIKKIKEGAISSDLIYGRLVSRDLTALLIQADFRENIDYCKLFLQLRKLQEKYQDENHTIDLAGRPIMLGWIDYYQHKLFPIFIAAILIMGVLLYLAFRIKRAIVLPLGGALLSVVWGLGFAGMLNYNLDPMTSLVPFLILGIAVSHSVQILKRYNENISLGLDSRSATIETLSHLLAPANVAIMTDGFAFALMIFVGVRMLESLAIIGTFGLLSCMINIVIFIPCVLSFLSPPNLRELKEASRPGLTERLLIKIAVLTTNHRSAWLILGGFCLFIIIGGIGTAKMEIGGRAPGAGAFYENSSYSRQQKNISKYFPGSITYYLIIKGKEDDSIKNYQVLNGIEKFQGFLEMNPSVGNTLSLVDYLKKMSVVLHDGEEKFYHLPRIGDPALGYCLNEKFLRKRVAEYLDLYTAGEPGQFDFMIDYDYRRTNIQVFLKDMEPDTVKTVLKQSKDWKKKNWSGAKAGEMADLHIAGGMAGMVGAINEELKEGLLKNITEISIIVFICCLIFLRSFIGATIVILSLFTRVIITYGIMGFGNIPLTMFTMPIASMGIGIGVDYVIYIIKRIEEELPKTKNQDFQDATIKALRSTGRAVIYTVMAVVLGVLIWVFSPMRFQMELGLMIGLIIFLNGVGAILLISPILFILKPKFIYRGCR